MTFWRLLMCAAAVALASASTALAQFVGERCDPDSEVLVIRNGAGDIYPSASIAEPVPAAEFVLICARPGDARAVVVWRESFSCASAATSAVVSWRTGGLIRVKCVVTEIDNTGEEAK